MHIKKLRRLIERYIAGMMMGEQNASVRWAPCRSTYKTEIGEIYIYIIHVCVARATKATFHRLFRPNKKRSGTFSSNLVGLDVSSAINASDTRFTHTSQTPLRVRAISSTISVRCIFPSFFCVRSWMSASIDRTCAVLVCGWSGPCLRFIFIARLITIG